MTLDPSFSVGSIIVLAGSILSCISTAVWARLTIARIETVVFNQNGEVRIISFEAHDRMKTECHKSIGMESQHAKENLERLERTSSEQNKEVVNEIRLLAEAVAVLSECVKVLSKGAKC
jgi:hypothetical protein